MLRRFEIGVASAAFFAASAFGISVASAASLPDGCMKDKGTVTCSTFDGPGNNQAGVGETTVTETQGNTTNKSPEPQDLEETPKGIALSALKEIEFDQATGKLSDEDYAMLKGKYTAQALEALRAEDVGPGSGDLETVIAVRARSIREQGSSTSTCPHCGPRPEQDAIFCSTCGCALDVRNCGQCSATLPPGSRFCDQCGTRVAA